METYHQFFPFHKAVEVLCDKWVILILRELMMGSHRFGQLRKRLPKISPSVLSRKLKNIEDQGIITRNKVSESNYQYHLTALGRDIQPIVSSFGKWGYKWAKNKITNENIDAGLLLWDMSRCLKIEYFDYQCVVIHIQFEDQFNADRYWWLLADRHGVDLCFEDIGQDPDVTIFTTLRIMTEVWLGRRYFEDMIRSRKIIAHGRKQYINQISQWFRRGGFNDS